MLPDDSVGDSGECYLMTEWETDSGECYLMTECGRQR